MKRIVDLLLAVPAIIVLSPILVLVATLIKLDSKGAVLFKQERVGKHFKPFYIYKFRTMVKGADKRGPSITAADDKRVTRVGKFLRKSKIDELPQLINVIKGEMSIVGPRPEVNKYVSLYTKEYEELLKVKPGITDISSMLFRDEENLLKHQCDPEAYYQDVHLPIKIELAKQYLMNASILFEFKLIIKTIYTIIIIHRQKQKETKVEARV